MTRFDETETAIDMIFSTPSLNLPHCPRCRSRKARSSASGPGWRLWKCPRCRWEANIPVQFGARYARDTVDLERRLADVLRGGLPESEKQAGAELWVRPSAGLIKKLRRFVAWRSVGRWL
ncbi:MAG: hypothetical protein ACYSWT_11935 [Planctomycetota bacterium]|jgi:hypothetical protein